MTLNNELNTEEAMVLCDQIIELNPANVCLCGGETLLRKDLSLIIKKITSKNIPVAIVTNGYLLDKIKALELKDAGVKTIQVSIDGSNPQTHDIFRNKKGSFKKALNAVKILSDIKVRTCVSFCPNKMNIREFGDYVDMIMKTPCREIRIMPLLPMGRGLINFKNLEPSKEEYFDLCMNIKKKSIEYLENNLIIDWGDPLEHIYLATLDKRKTPIVMEIGSTGDLEVSSYLPIKVGNVRQHSLKEYWDGGYDKIWDNQIVKKIASRVKNLYDLSWLNTWNSKHIRIDILSSEVKRAIT